MARRHAYDSRAHMDFGGGIEFSLERMLADPACREEYFNMLEQLGHVDSALLKEFGDLLSELDTSEDPRAA